MRKNLTPTQVKILRQIYAQQDPLIVNSKDRRTLNVLARRNLITFEYCDSSHEYYDGIRCKRKASNSRVEKAIAESSPS